VTYEEAWTHIFRTVNDAVKIARGEKVDVLEDGEEEEEEEESRGRSRCGDLPAAAPSSHYSHQREGQDGGAKCQDSIESAAARTVKHGIGENPFGRNLWGGEEYEQLRREDTLRNSVIEGIGNDLLDAKGADDDGVVDGTSSNGIEEQCRTGAPGLKKEMKKQMWSDISRMEKLLDPEERAFVQRLFGNAHGIGEKRHNATKSQRGSGNTAGDADNEHLAGRFEKWKDYAKNQESRRKSAPSLHHRRGKANSRMPPSSSIPHHDNETYHTLRGDKEQARNNTNDDECSSGDFREQYLDGLAYLTPKMEKRLVMNMYRGAIRNKKKNKSDLQIMSEKYEKLILSGAADEDSDRSRCWRGFDN